MAQHFKMCSCNYMVAARRPYVRSGTPLVQVLSNRVDALETTDDTAASSLAEHDSRIAVVESRLPDGEVVLGDFRLNAREGSLRIEQPVGNVVASVDC